MDPLHPNNPTAGRLSKAGWAPCLLVAVVAAGCGKDEDSSASAAASGPSLDECGDVDGSGGDTGDVPNILGAWTASFASQVYDGGGCSVPGLEATDMRAMLDGVMYVDGRIPDQLFVTFNQSDDRFFGVENFQGGVTFTGNKSFGSHDLTISLGGLLFNQPQVDRDEIRGYGFIGVDLDGADGSIDCWLQGDFLAIRSGA